MVTKNKTTITNQSILNLACQFRISRNLPPKRNLQKFSLWPYTIYLVLLWSYETLKMQKIPLQKLNTNQHRPCILNFFKNVDITSDFSTFLSFVSFNSFVYHHFDELTWCKDSKIAYFVDIFREVRNANNNYFLSPQKSNPWCWKKQ